jgi:uncharacterized protein
MTPARQFVVKLHSRCNLACAYCYVYEHADQGWRAQPAVMSDATIDAVAVRIGAYAARHALPRVTLTVHGGEPLLAGPARIARLVTAVRAAVPAVDVGLQTNGTLLDEAALAVIRAHDIAVGVSVDGGRAAHDRHRRYADGRGSFARAAEGVRALGPHLAGLLCTVDLANDPVGTYEDLLALGPPAIDLLLPHGNWTSPPPGRVPRSAAAPYGEWLIAVFDRWYDAPRRETGVRLFESVISLLLGGPSRTEAVGPRPAGIVTIETDGSYEATDALKSAAPGLAATGLNVHRHDVEAAAAHPVLLAQRGGPPRPCAPCPLLRVCGGGLFAHRWSAESGFDRPSVYCPDLFALVTHVRRRVSVSLAAR